MDEETPTEEAQDSHVLKTTLILYLPAYFVILLVFSILRQHFPKVYKVRNVVDRLNCDLAQRTYGFLDWIWHLWKIPENEIFDQCGMDALCLSRILRMGLSLSLCGMFCSIFLLPTYATAPHDDDESSVDGWVKLTTSNLQSGSDRFTATVLAAYLLFGYAMYLILAEFRWFTVTRGHFLSRPLARSYTVYVTGIPKMYQCDSGLEGFFQTILSPDAVFSASVALSMPKLTSLTNEKKTLQKALDHVRAAKEKDDADPSASSARIDDLQSKIVEVEQEIESVRTQIQARRDEACKKWVKRKEHLSRSKLLTSQVLLSSSILVGTSPSSNKIENETTKLEERKKDFDSSQDTAKQNHSAAERKAVEVSLDKDMQDQNKGDEELGHVDQIIESEEGNRGLDSLRLPNLSYPSLERLCSADEGRPLDAGFVTFTKLSSVSAVLQMIHSTKPFEMDMWEAPSPEGILWNNVGKSHQALQVGRLLSVSMTGALCLFWTVPITFLVSLTEVNSLKKDLPFLEDWLESAPWLEPLLNQIAPLLVSLLDSIVLPLILKEASRLEGAVAVSLLECSLFWKLAVFHIVQTFFVASIAGTITSALASLDTARDFFQYLARTLPPQSVFFMQLLLIQTVIGLGTELLRTTAVIQASLRSKVGPRLTEEERSSPWLGLRPLCSPRDFLYARVFANVSLDFMILFSFSLLSPLVSIVLAFVFISLESGFRHQLVYIYPNASPDSGGRIWIAFMVLAIGCMLLAESILLSYLALAEAQRHFAATIPLICVTVLFTVYVSQKHFRVALYLSSAECVKFDSQNEDIIADGDILRDEYLQPALKRGNEVDVAQSAVD